MTSIVNLLLNDIIMTTEILRDFIGYFRLYHSVHKNDTESWKTTETSTKNYDKLPLGAMAPAGIVMTKFGKTHWCSLFFTPRLFLSVQSTINQHSGLGNGLVLKRRRTFTRTNGDKNRESSWCQLCCHWWHRRLSYDTEDCRATACGAVSDDEIDIMISNVFCRIFAWFSEITQLRSIFSGGSYFSDSRNNFYGNNITLRAAYLPTGAKKAWFDYEIELPEGTLTTYYVYVHNISQAGFANLKLQIWRPTNEALRIYTLVWEKTVEVDLSSPVGILYRVSKFLSLYAL